MAQSRLYSRPGRRSDVLGHVKWEYDRLRLLTRLPSSRFYYKKRARTEVARGASSAKFCFVAVYGEQYGNRCSVTLEGKRARKDCLTRFITPFSRITDGFTKWGGLPDTARLKPEDSVDEMTWAMSMLKVQYMARMLLDWFIRVRAVLLAKIDGLSGDKVMSVTPFVTDGLLPRAAWDWAKAQVDGFNRSRRSGSDELTPHMQVLMRCVQAVPRPGEPGNDPSTWSFRTPTARAGEASADADPAEATSQSQGAPREDGSPGGPPPPDPPGPPDPPDPPDGGGGGAAPPAVSIVNYTEEEDADARAAFRASPPIPSHPRSQAQDMSAVAGVDLMIMLFANIKLVQTVPACFREAWARANTTVYTWVLNSEPDSQERDNALYWELLLHRMLLRKSPRNNKSGVDSMAARFKAFALGDYQYLVSSLATICRKVGITRRVRNVGSDDLHRIQKLLSKGRFSKAFRLIDSNGLASMADPGVVRQLERKNGPRVHQLPGSLPLDLPPKIEFDHDKFRLTYRQLKPLSGTGPDGYRNEYLYSLAAGMSCNLSLEAVRLHKEFAEGYVNADWPAWYYWVTCAIEEVGLIKSPADTPGGTPDVRPIGMGGCKRRAWTSRLCKDNAPVFKTTFWPVQVAIGVKAGIPKLIMAATEHMRAHPNQALLKLDFTNAFGTVWRAAVLRACYNKPEWRHLYRFLWATLSPKAYIKGLGTTSDEGAQQGDVAGPCIFSFPLQPHAEWVNRRLKMVGGLAVFDMDDGYLMGPIEDLMELVEMFQARLKEHVGACLNPSKCQLWCNSQYRSHVTKFLRDNPSQFKLASVKLPSGHKTYGVKVSGVPFGDMAYVNFMMAKKVDSVVSLIKKSTKKLQQTSAQNLFALLVQCMNCRMQFWLTCMDPVALKPHLRKFDAAIMRAVRVSTGQQFPGGSLAYKRLRWPRRLCGGMIRSAVDVSKAAYLGGICQCVPSFTSSVDAEGIRHEGILDHMEDTYGRGVFDAGNEFKRFQTMLDSGCTLGTQLRHYFTLMRTEVHGSEPDDSLPGDSPFSHGPAGAGVVLDEVLLRPQKEFTEWLENERARVQLHALEVKTARRGVQLKREEVALLSVNRGSTAFVGVPAMETSRMDNITYRECWASYLGGPSPICAQWVGTVFYHSKGRKRAVIDKYGDSVSCATLKGDAYRIRHDNFKWTVAEQAAWCRFQLHTEPMHKFLPFINQRQAFMRAKHRKRQGLVPDFLDVRNQRLLDVKTMTFGSKYGPARFRHARRCDSVKIRGLSVHREVSNKARDIDITYNGWRPESGNLGPVQQRLQGFGRIKGLVVVTHGEFSPDLINLIEQLSKQGASSRHRDMGFDNVNETMSTVKQQVFLSLGIEAARDTTRMRIDNFDVALDVGRQRLQQPGRSEKTKEQGEI